MKVELNTIKTGEALPPCIKHLLIKVIQMEETTILYLVWAITKKQFIDATILYYDIDEKVDRSEHVEKVLEENRFAEFINNILANTQWEYKYH